MPPPTMTTSDLIVRAGSGNFPSRKRCPVADDAPRIAPGMPLLANRPEYWPHASKALPAIPLAINWRLLNFIWRQALVHQILGPLLVEITHQSLIIQPLYFGGDFRHVCRKVKHFPGRILAH